MLQAIERLAGYRRRRESRRVLRGLPSRYRVESELGQGGMAVVYLARDQELDRQVAVKLLHPGLAIDREAVVRLGNEARLVAQLQHPNIVAIHDIVALEDGGVALVMQYVGGDTLAGVLDASGGLPVERVERILKEIASALSAAHRRGIIHRDVKPENIYIEQESGRAMLADFGIARAPRIDLGRTAEGEALGTPHYMSPEQIAGGHMDGRSDLYSLALVGYEMLTGARPWSGEPLDRVLHKQQHEYLPSLTLQRPDVPISLERALGKALRKNPILRPATADDFSSLLQRRDRPRTSRYDLVAEPGSPPPQVSHEATPHAPTVRIDRSGNGVPIAMPADPPDSGDAASPSASDESPRGDRMPFLLQSADGPSNPLFTRTNGAAPRPPHARLPVRQPVVDEVGPTVVVPRKTRSSPDRVDRRDETFLAAIFSALAGAAAVAGVVVGVGVSALPRDDASEDVPEVGASLADQPADATLPDDSLVTMPEGGEVSP